MISLDRREEALKCSRRRFGLQSDGLNAFTLQARHLAQHVTEQMSRGLAVVKTVVKLLQKHLQFLANVPDTLYVHVDSPPNQGISRTYRQNIFKSLSHYGAVILTRLAFSMGVGIMKSISQYRVPAIAGRHAQRAEAEE